MSHYDVCDFSIEKLKEYLAQGQDAITEIINTKNHVTYFETYLNEFPTATIVIKKASCM